MALQSAVVNVMEMAAQKAGRKLTRDFGEVEQLQVSRKGPASFVSSADLKAEKIIRQELFRARPNFGFLQADSGPIESGDGSARWIIDAIDGTTNFLHGIPHFCTTIALEQNGEITTCLMYNPITDETYWAEKGRGAFLNSMRFRISARRNLAESLFATDLPFHGQPNLKSELFNLDTILNEVSGVRSFGCTSLDLAYVASGKYEGFWASNQEQWNMAAGMLMVKEAGGMVTSFDGREKMLEKGEILATNGIVHGPITRLLSKARKQAKSEGN